jgi:adenylylsulfate kinase-like enzyme
VWQAPVAHLRPAARPFSAAGSEEKLATTTVGASTNIRWHEGSVSRQEKQGMLDQKAVVLWMTGLSGSGKSCLAYTVEHALTKEGKVCVVLDGDNVRHGLNKNLGFSAEDRAENIRRVGEWRRQSVPGAAALANVTVCRAYVCSMYEDTEPMYEDTEPMSSGAHRLLRVSLLLTSLLLACFRTTPQCILMRRQRPLPTSPHPTHCPVWCSLSLSFLSTLHWHCMLKGEVAKLFVDSGVITIVSFISPYRADRDAVRELFSTKRDFLEVYMDIPIGDCEKRDPKGLYAKARQGLIQGFTGVNDPYEEPLQPELRYTDPDATPQDMAEDMIEYLSKNGYLRAAGPDSSSATA